MPLWRQRRGDKAAAGSGLIGMVAVVAVLHVTGWFVLLAVVIPQHLTVGGKAFGIGIGMAAYLLGMRHAFDADHIAAIDNTTRKLMHDASPSLSVGFWFSLGHSSVVFVLVSLVAAGIRGVIEPVLDAYSSSRSIVDLVGTLISSGFLYVVAIINLGIFAELWRTFRRLRAGPCKGASTESEPELRGLMSRVAAPVMRIVRRPHQMYLVGFLFGLGFDTATEVALLVLTTSGATSGLPWYAILCLPVLFAAGMSLLDTADGIFMSFAYRWAFTKPARKIGYNLVVTGLSVVAALIVGTIEIAALVGEKLKLGGAIWAWAENVDLSTAGVLIVGLFVAVWTAAVTIRRRSRSIAAIIGSRSTHA